MKNKPHKSKNTNEKLCKLCQKSIKHSLIFCDRLCANLFNGKLKAKFITVTCEVCKIQEDKPQYLIDKRLPHYLCSTSCKKHFKNLKKIKINCSLCNKEILKTPSEMRKSKSNLHFCSGTCRMTFFNKNRKFKNKSFPEDFLYEKTLVKFPNIQILRNNRKVLNGGYEIDLYFPDLKFGIEVNGPVHYMPIFGEKRLQQAQFNDAIKYQEMTTMGISFLIIDVSMQISKKKMTQHLLKQLEDNIFPLIESKIIS